MTMTKEIFEFCDADKDGKLNRNEFFAALVTMKYYNIFKQMPILIPKYFYQQMKQRQNGSSIGHMKRKSLLVLNDVIEDNSDNSYNPNDENAQRDSSENISSSPPRSKSTIITERNSKRGTKSMCLDQIVMNMYDLKHNISRSHSTTLLGNLSSDDFNNLEDDDYDTFSFETDTTYEEDVDYHIISPELEQLDRELDSLLKEKASLEHDIKQLQDELDASKSK